MPGPDSVIYKGSDNRGKHYATLAHSTASGTRSARQLDVAGDPGSPARYPGELTEMAVRSGGAKWGRIHSGMATWRAAKTARVTAMAGIVRRISAPAVTPRVNANAA